MKKIGNLLGAIVLYSLAGTANASLIGDTINASGSSLGPASATIGGGVEFYGISGYIGFDFGADSLTLTSSSSVGWGGFGNYVFSAFDTPITSLSILSNTGFSGTVISGFSFTADSITLDISSGGAASAESSLVFGIGQASEPVPAPATLALLGLGLAGLRWSRRKKA